ncbi:amidase [Microtetraspora malaysiensis]|uniref:amidase n=1 Tax=Microtetraspora malaysiensis TaxID=161358 RepID=UPI003D8E90FA
MTADKPPALLAGRTAVAKDMIDVAGMPTTFGTAGAGGAPATVSADCVTAVEEHGALVIAKSNLDEYAWGVTGENPHWGRILNPRHPDLVAGGSSGGTAAAIAAGIADVGLGTDTAGSVRIPAACCGVVGLRPRVGRVSMRGVHPLSPSFDTVGPMAATVAECARTWAALVGEPVAHGKDAALLAAGVRLGVMEDCPQARHFEALGIELVPLDSPREILPAFWTVMRAEAYRTHAARYTAHQEDYGQSIRVKLDLAATITASEEAAARAALTAQQAAFTARFAGLDGFILPTLGRAAPPAGVDENSIRDELGPLAAMVSALGLAALAIGNLQIVARDEETALALGLLWESHVGEVPEPW